MKEHGTKRTRGAGAVLGLLILAACRYRAMAIPNGRGGFTLVTTVGTVEQAVTRFQRTARRECPGPYTLSDPQVVQQGFRSTLVGPSSRVTMQATLVCGTTAP